MRVIINVYHRKTIHKAEVVLKDARRDQSPLTRVATKFTMRPKRGGWMELSRRCEGGLVRNQIKERKALALCASRRRLYSEVVGGEPDMPLGQSRRGKSNKVVWGP